MAEANGTKVTIHRRNQIGGCITEIATGKTHILIDFGEELPGSRSGEDVKILWEDVDAVLFTHYHGDHIGRFAVIPTDIPLYMSELSQKVLVNIHGYLSENLPKVAERDTENSEQILSDAGKHKDALDILLNGDRIHTFRPHENEHISIGDIEIIPIWVDHSACDACMFFIRTPDKTILHTGDFRGHGAHDQTGEDILKAIASLGRIDVLVIEGTMMSRQNEKPYSEMRLLADAKRLFAAHRHVFLVISSTNLDSINTFYQAAEEQSLPMYCHNPYMEIQLRTLGEYANEHWGITGLDRVRMIKRWSRSELEKLKEDGFVTTIKANKSGKELIQKFRDYEPAVVFSMWPGYITRGLDKDLCKFYQWCQEQKIPFMPSMDGTPGPYGPLHTSGHASTGLIAEVIRTADPGEILPIHTEDAKGFLRLDISNELKSRIQFGQDAETTLNRKRGERTSLYDEKRDHRYLSSTSLKKFLCKGSHHMFIKLVKQHPNDLAFCFRGNSQNAGIIYYKNHVMFHIMSRGKVKFNFNHARYMQDWQERKALLEKFGYRGFRDTQEFSSASCDVTMSAERAAALTLEELEELYNCLGTMIRIFSEKQNLTEKSIQQKLFLASNNPGNEYCFYDLEFSQPYGDELDCKNQADMMAIRFNREGRPVRLVFAEVKSTREAVDGGSGLEAHINGMEKYHDWLLKVRGRDAYHILKQYNKLGLMPSPERDFILEEFEELQKEFLLIFTGTAIDALRKNSYQELVKEKGYTKLTAEEFPNLLGMGQAEVYRKDFWVQKE